MTISFIGGGVMAEALIKGIINSGISNSKNIKVSEPLVGRCSYLESEYGITTVRKNRDLIDNDGLLVLAVKPQTLPQVYSDLSGKIKHGRSVVSIAAGITSSAICKGLSHTSVIRVMPNTPSLIGQGVSGMFAPHFIDQSFKKMTENLMSSVGKTIWLKNEEQINDIIALSGSSPAYFFLFLH